MKEGKSTQPRKAAANSWYIAKTAYRMSPSRPWVDITAALCSSLQLVYISIVFIRWIMNGLENRIPFSQSLWFLIGSALLFAGTFFYQIWYDLIYLSISDQKIREGFHKLLFEKASQVDIACYENPEYFDEYTKSLSNADQNVQKVLRNLVSILQSLITVVSISTYLAVMDVGMLIIAAVPVAATLTFGKKLNQRTYALDNANVYPERVKEYVRRIVYLPEHAPIMRTTRLLDCLLLQAKEAVSQILLNTKDLGKRNAVLQIIQRAFTYVFPLVCGGLYVTYLVMIKKNAGIGDFAVMAVAITNLSGTIRYIVQLFMRFGELSYYIDHMREFLSASPDIPEDFQGEHIPEKTQHAPEITFEQVSFSYPGKEEDSIRDISFTFHPGETIAVVGLNGAGKSTLIKLLLRFYDPTEGQILLNGTDIRRYTLSEYRRLFSALFQDYHLYAMSVQDNLEMGSRHDENQAMEAIRMGGFTKIYDRLQQNGDGMQSILTKEFDENGQVLSGGEGQKLAASRMFYRDSPIVLLDEPASALDPLSENELFEHLKGLHRKRSILMVAHNLASIRFADQILLMKNGTILEQGTHEDLMNRKGTYAEMFSLQAKSYAGKKVESLD